MRNPLLVLLSFVVSSAAMAQQVAGSCSIAAAQKNLVGSAKTAFVKKCEMDLKAMSTVASKQKKPMVGSREESYGDCGHKGADL